MATEIVWEGFTLGGDDNGSDRLRVLSRPGRPAITGLGQQAPDASETGRLAGGSHYGPPRVRPRAVTVPRLQCRGWTVAQAFAASMQPSLVALPLRIVGGPHGVPVVLWVHSEGASPVWDVDALGDREVVHVGDARWVAPDPTVYEADPTAFTGTATSATPLNVAWSNPGDSTPPHGLGGRAWILEAKASGAVRGVWIDQGPGTERVEFRGVIVPSGSMLVVGADRVPTVRSAAGAVVPVVAWSRHAGQWVPDPVWPRFAPGVASRLRIGCTAGSLAVDGEFRGTWS